MINFQKKELKFVKPLYFATQSNSKQSIQSICLLQHSLPYSIAWLMPGKEL
jgi:hypothetical protein